MLSEREKVLKRKLTEREKVSEKSFSFMCRKAPSGYSEDKSCPGRSFRLLSGCRPDFFRRVDVWLGRSHLSPHKRAKGESDTGLKMNLKLLKL